MISQRSLFAPWLFIHIKTVSMNGFSNLDGSIECSYFKSFM
jgi:hypothetical protein